MEPHSLELATTASVPGLGLLRLEIACRSLLLSQCGHVCVLVEAEGSMMERVSDDKGDGCPEALMFYRVRLRICGGGSLNGPVTVR